MTFKPHGALITGGGTGIGRAIAEKLHQRGVKVIIGGRRKDVLEEVCQLNAGMEFVVLDVASEEGIVQIRDELLAKYPELDCVINNAGMQRIHSFADEKPLDLHFADAEIGINITGLFMMCAAWVPHLKTRKASHLINVSSGLAFVPLVRCPVYCATKAAVHSFTVSLRFQLKDTPVKVVEIEPPAVQTELHDYVGDHGRGIGMPLADFTRECMEHLDAGEEDFAVAGSKVLHDVVDEERFQKAFAIANHLTWWQSRHCCGEQQ